MKVSEETTFVESDINMNYVWYISMSLSYMLSLETHHILRQNMVCGYAHLKTSLFCARFEENLMNKQVTNAFCETVLVLNLYSRFMEKVSKNVFSCACECLARFELKLMSGTDWQEAFNFQPLRKQSHPGLLVLQAFSWITRKPAAVDKG